MKNRILPLDGLRAIAAFGVIWIHVWAFYANPSLMISSLNLYKLMAILGNGVDFFFVISGFCMYLMIDKSFSWKGYKHFLYKRLLRIAPAYFVSILVYASIIKVFNPSFHFFYNVFFHFLFLNNVVTGNTISGPFWSLGTEWHFYMILPFFIWFSNKISLMRSVLLFSFSSIIFMCIINLGYLNYYWWQNQIFVRFPEFGIGIIGAYLYLKNWKLPLWLSGIKGLVIGFVIMYSGRTFMVTEFLAKTSGMAFIFKSIAEPVMCLGFCTMLYNLISQPSIVSRVLSLKPITYLGRISFSVYLWHSLSILILAHILKSLPYQNYNPIIAFILVSLLTILIAHFSYSLFESLYFKRPLKIKNNLVKKEATVVNSGF